ncbi:hypothetical protein ACFY1V_31765 [Streptomyces sp. NPDC001255]|uniref:hypothetical protein n=1 Tax=Streptomyces sp. NPDC001255 TaxID=3364550 RepID=UPI0036B72EE3
MARRDTLMTPELERAVRRAEAARRADVAARGAFAHVRALRVEEVDLLTPQRQATARLLGLDISTVSRLLTKLAEPERTQQPPTGHFLGPRGAERTVRLADRARQAVHARDIPPLTGSHPSAPKETGDLDRREDVAEWSERLVPVLVARVAEDLPHHRAETTGLWAHLERPWQWASPDRLLVPDADDAGYGVLECLALPGPLGPDWGTPAAPDAPEDIRARAVWTADTLGADFALVAALGAGWDYRAVRIPYDPAQARALRETVAAAREIEAG